MAARRSPWLPVASTSTRRRGTVSMSMMSRVSGKLSRTSAARAVLSMVFIARPRTTGVRPAARPASARVFRRATFEAKVVATTRPSASCISWPIGSISVASERPGWRLKTFVELTGEHADARRRRARASLAVSNGSPTSGVGSDLKSALWKIRPAGVSMTRAELSGIEWAIGKKPTLNGPACTACGQGPTWRTASVGWPARSIFDLASAAVKRRA